tara:strand:+ start:604 stop:1431 length:828 start_codon:yes stop_codon:yes gene_type:complete
MKIFRRPMFRKGGEAMTGIMENITPRQNYRFGDNVTEEGIADYISLVKGGDSVKADPLTDFLLTFGPNLMSQRPIGRGLAGALATAGAASKEPLSDLVKAGRARRSEDLALRAKAIDTLGVDDLKKIRAQAKVALGPKLSTETDEDYDARVQKKMGEFVESTYSKSDFLKADSPEEKIFDDATRLMKDGTITNRPQATNRATFENRDYNRLKSAGVDIQLDRAKKLFSKKGLKRNAKPGLYYDDVTDTYTRIGVNEDGRPFVQESNITIDTLIGG